MPGLLTPAVAALPHCSVIPMTRLSRFAPLIAAFAFAVASPSRADAQFGGLIKKAQDKVAEKAGPVAPGEQLTGDLVGKLLAGLQAANRVIGDRDKVATDREAKKFAQCLQI